MRHIVIGDVHGCLQELQELVGLLDLQRDDRLYFIGDLIDRGPDSAGTVKYVRRLSESNHTVLITGNHEEKFLRYCHHKRSPGGVPSGMKGRETYEEYLQIFQHEDLEFLAESYLNYHIPEQGVCLIHGGIPEHLNIDLHLNHPYSPGLLKKLKGADLLLKTRFLDATGHFVGLGQETPECSFWAERYDGRYGRVVFGHHAIVTDTAVAYTYALNVDTGCVYGGWLSACIIENGKFRITGVRARYIYATKI